jgi:hypothetical protein
MSDVYIKTPNSDDIFSRWVNSVMRSNKKKLEKEFGTKGAVFSSNTISGAESVNDTMKEVAIYYEIKKTIAPVKGKEQVNLIPAPRLSRETFYSFKGSQVIKENWKGKDKVPIIETLKGVQCKNCKGRGFVDIKCRTCKGGGKIEERWDVLVGEKQEKQKKIFDYPCGDCHGTGNIRDKCKECGGHKNLYNYNIGPVPFKTVISGTPVLHSSAQTKYERQIEEDLHKLIKDVEGIKFNDFKTLGQKAEASLGYYNKNIKKTISASGADYNKAKKDPNTEVVTQIYLFPMIQLMCASPQGTKFEIYSIGSAQKFMVYSNF